MSSKVLLAALAASIVSFFGGWLIFGILLSDFYDANSIMYEGMEKMPPVLWAIFLAGFSFNLLGAIVFDKWANIRSFMPGFMAGLWIGLLTILYIDLSYYAFFNLMSVTGLAVDIVVNTIFFGVLGGVIGQILGMGKKEAATA